MPNAPTSSSLCNLHQNFFRLIPSIVHALTKSCIWSVALYGSETWTLGENEESATNQFETRCWRRMLKIKWTDRIMIDEVFQKVKEERLL